MVTLDGRGAEQHLGFLVERKIDRLFRIRRVDDGDDAFAVVFAGIRHHIPFGVDTFISALPQDLVLVPQGDAGFGVFEQVLVPV